MDGEAHEHHHAAANVIMLVKGLLNNMEEGGLKKAVDALTQDVGGYTDQLRSTVLMMLDQLPRGWWVDANAPAPKRQRIAKSVSSNEILTSQSASGGAGACGCESGCQFFWGFQVNVLLKRRN